MTTSAFPLYSTYKENLLGPPSPLVGEREDGMSCLAKMSNSPFLEEEKEQVE